jgi:hypothetical protein
VSDTPDLQRDQVVIDEQQDIVYRDAASTAGQASALSADAPAVLAAPGMPTDGKRLPGRFRLFN